MAQFFADYIGYMKKKFLQLFLSLPILKMLKYKKINPPLFSWVVKIFKNAADAMQGEGKIEVNMTKVNQGVSILIKDSEDTI